MKSGEEWATEFQGIGILPSDVERIQADALDHAAGIAKEHTCITEYEEDGIKGIPCGCNCFVNIRNAILAAKKEVEQ